MRRRLRATAAFVLFALASAAAESAVMPIQGDWRLDERASRNVPDAMKGVDLKIWLKGKELYTQRLFEGAPVGEPLVVPLDGVPTERELSKGQRGTIEGRWKADGKLLEQVVKMKQQNLIPIVQTTLVSVSADGKTMTRIQTTQSAGDSTERILIYRRK
jgi:hypothetical protein